VTAAQLGASIATPENSVLFSKLNPDHYIVTDEAALKRLVGLRK
jgi:hypothetical protein